MQVFRRGAPPVAKVTLPHPAAGVLHRPRLYQRLQQARVGLWVGAPPAAGKTVLAAACLRNTGRPALWYQIDGGDADPGAFFHFLGHAAAQLAPRRRGAALPRYGREVGTELDDYARAWFRTLFASLPPDVTLVFDDWHRLGDEHPLQAVLPSLLDELPASARLWVLSRLDAPRRLDSARLHGRLHTLGLADLALTVDEAQDLVALQAPAAAARLPGLGERWHRWCDGWIGALVFGLAAGRDEPATLPTTGGTDDAADSADMTPVFNVLATELLDQATPALRDFMLATAWAPFVNEGLARQLCHSADVAPHIRHLVQRHLLIAVGHGHQATWRYHRLLRESLLARARSSWPDAERSLKLAHFAACLDGAGLPEPAASLLIDAQHWDALAQLLLRHAEQLLQQGRHHTIEAWAQALPDTARTPWVDFWWAGALLVRNARLGQLRYEQAYAGFWTAGDAEGLYRSWCGVIEGATFACDDYGVLHRWLLRLRELRQRFPRYPSLLVRAQITVFGFSAACFLHPRPPEFGPWLRSVQRLYRFAPRRADRAAIGALIGLHHAANSGMGALGAHLHSLRPLLDDPAVPAFYRMVGGVCDVIQQWIGGSTQQALDRLAQFDQLGRETGTHAIDTQLHLQSVYVHCIRGELAAADGHLQRVARGLAGLGQLDVAHYHFLLGWRAALAGRADEAMRLLEMAAHDTRSRRFALLEAVSRGLLGELLAASGQFDAARLQCDQALDLAQRMDSVTAQTPCTMHRAAVADLAGVDAAELARRLQQAFGCARQHGHWAWGGLLPTTLARLCLRALELGIETEHVRELIRRRGLQPPAAAATLRAWPWPLKVLGLGDLQLLHDDPVPERSGGKASQRPLDLVRALLAHAPRPLPVHTALQWIWPDTEAADQRKAFDVALLRARRLLGDDSLLRLEGGCLSFDSTRVWTDVQALLDLASRIGDARETGAGAARAWAEQLLDLARGPLLAGDDTPWVQSARERLRRRLAAAAERLAAWLAPQDAALARRVLQRAFDQDPASEPLAQRLAEALAQAGDRREAQRVLQLCLSTRELTGEPPLGPGIRALAQRLGGAPNP